MSQKVHFSPQCKWIAGPLEGNGRFAPVVPLFQRDFEINDTSDTLLRVTALGVVHIEVNGSLVSGDYFTPGWTNYSKRIHVREYNLSSIIRQGRNSIRVWLGDGWAVGRIAHLDRQNYAAKPSFCLEIMREGQPILVTDSDWQVGPSGILRSDMLDGEVYDARKAEPSTWCMAEVVQAPDAALVLHPCEPVRATELIQAKDGPYPVRVGWGMKAYRWDLGQNFSGNVRIRVKGPAGTTLRLRYAEILNEDGTLYTANLRSAQATDYYTLSGDAKGETWTPKFTFHGFRHVEIAVHEKWYGQLAPFTPETVAGLAIHTDVAKIGTFTCSDDRLNKLFQNIDWGLRSNFLEVPTDCPQRDERLGWTGDIQVFAPTALAIRDCAAFLQKWLLDVADAQLESGGVPCVAPNLDNTEDGGPGWSDATVLVPQALIEATGKTDFLAEYLPTIMRWSEWQAASRKDGIRCYNGCGHFKGFGDWVALDEPTQPYHGGTPIDLIGTAYFVRSQRAIASLPIDPRYPQAAAIALRRADESRMAFQREYWREGRLTKETQTGYLMALAFDLLEEHDQPVAFERLLALLRANGNKLTTGFLGTPLLLPTLNRFGMGQLALEILTSDTYPGWLFSVKNGATTTWERWNSWTPEGFGDVNMNSFNHYAYGCVGKFMLDAVAGLSIHYNVDGQLSVRCAPIVGGPISSASTSRETPSGRISVRWEEVGGEIVWRGMFPPGVTAQLEIGNEARTVEGEAELNVRI